MTPRELPPSVLQRRAVVYVRPSTSTQVKENLESQRCQDELADLARTYGFHDVAVIDEDLGRSASGATARPGFRNLVGQICEGRVGTVFCLEASRLARNGREWHHVIEFCGLVGSRVIDTEGIHDPSTPNDRLLLGLKGTMSEFELTVLRRRLLDAMVAKARRGELRMPVPVGYVWSQDTGLMMDPDRRVQEVIRSVFRLFDRFGSARQVMLHMRREALVFPRPADGKRMSAIAWRDPAYRNVMSVLQNPFYAGAYAYGKSAVQTKIVEGVVRKKYGNARPMDAWTVLLRDHHEAYISWEQFEQTQTRLARNAFGKRAGSAKSGRGGRALMAGLSRCRRCGRMLRVTYGGRGIPSPRYTCRGGHTMQGVAPCLSFGARRPDDTMAQEILLAVQPVAVEAALVAERDASLEIDECRRALALERQQAAYEVKLAARRYESVDPDNRLVAAELEARWNTAMARLRDGEARCTASAEQKPSGVTKEALQMLATDLPRAWSAKGTEMRTKQRLVRALVEEVLVDVEDATREVVLVIHWRGGQHSELRVRKPETGEPTKRTSEEADRGIRDMATRWSDADIAATLNRMGLRTGHEKTWTEIRVGTYRRTAAIPGYESAINDGRCLTLLEAAQKLGVTCHALRKLITTGVLPAHQVIKDAPWQIQATNLERAEIREALHGRLRRRGRPCRNSRNDRNFVIPGT